MTLNNVSAKTLYLLDLNSLWKHMKTVWKHLTDRKIKKETLHTHPKGVWVVSIVSIFLTRQL
jgi:hypothetical protein